MVELAVSEMVLERVAAAVGAPGRPITVMRLFIPAALGAVEVMPRASASMLRPLVKTADIPQLRHRKVLAVVVPGTTVTMRIRQVKAVMAFTA